jgi:hypothetical protein
MSQYFSFGVPVTMCTLGQPGGPALLDDAGQLASPLMPGAVRAENIAEGVLTSDKFAPRARSDAIFSRDLSSLRMPIVVSGDGKGAFALQLITKIAMGPVIAMTLQHDGAGSSSIAMATMYRVPDTAREWNRVSWSVMAAGGDPGQCALAATITRIAATPTNEGESQVVAELEARSPSGTDAWEDIELDMSAVEAIPGDMLLIQLTMTTATMLHVRYMQLSTIR